MSMRINSRNWPIWVIATATVWFVAIAVFWAARPLVDHVPTTAAHVATPAEVSAAQNSGTAAPTRVAGPTIDVECGTPASSTARNRAGEQIRLARVVDTNGTPLVDAQFGRVPCVEAHHQAHLLWYGNTALFALTVAGMVTVLVRRRRHQHLPEGAFATT